MDLCPDAPDNRTDSLAREYYSKGIGFAQRGHVQEAIEALDHAISANSRLMAAYYVKGGLLQELKLYQEAVDCYDKAIAVDSKHAESWYDKAITLEKLGRSEEARFCFREAVRLNPALDDGRFGKGRLQTARASFMKDQAPPPAKPAPAPVEVAQAEVLQTDIIEGEIVQGEVIEAEVMDDGGDVAPVMVIEDGAAPQMVQPLEPVEDTAPSPPSGRYRIPQIPANPTAVEKEKAQPAALAPIPAIAAEPGKKPRQAWEEEPTAVVQQPQDDYSIAPQKGQWLTRETTTPPKGQVLDFNPRAAKVRVDKGIKFIALRQYEVALFCFEEALSVNPKYAPALMNKGVVLSRMGKFEEASEFIEKAIESNPNSPDAWYQKGAILALFGVKAEAHRCFQKAHELSQV
ncbi:MAG TPA: tetratricopeptide repeat protein [Candidatus Brocadiia bacterium]|nr:tetratricopeptide repeat protein [Candidatus Brocadiia bacterium]